MADGSGDRAALAARRRDLLETLADSPTTKRELVDELDKARSTINRAIGELEAAGLVEETDAGVAITLAGRLVLESHREYLDHVTAVGEARAILDVLPAGADLSPVALVNATTVLATGPDPYRPLARLDAAVDTGDRVAIVLPSLPHPNLLDRCRVRAREDEVPVDLVVPAPLYEHLRDRFADVLAAIGGHGGSIGVCDFDTQLGVVAGLPDGTVSIVAYTPDRAVHGVVENDAPAAVDWANRFVDRHLRAARDVTGDLDPSDVSSTPRYASPNGTNERTGHSSGPPTDDPVTDAGFERLVSNHVRGAPADSPMVAWRSGPTVREIAAGFAVEREHETGEGRAPIAATIERALAAGTNRAVLGPPGAGKSVTCRSVAARWLEADRGTVYYRPSNATTPIDDAAALDRLLDRGTGHVLFVVEDAVDPDASPVLAFAGEVTDRPDVSVLVDARDGDWRRLEDLTAAERAGRTSFEAATMPPLDRRATERLVDRFEATTGATVDIDPDAVLDRLETDAHRAPGDVLLVLHRLVAAARSTGETDEDATSPLEADVERRYRALRAADGERTFQVAVLVNLLNAAGVAVDPAHLHALAPRADHDAIEAAINDLDGHVLFRSGDGYRTVHPSWSIRFLDRLRETEPEPVASRWVGRCLTDLLALAERDELRARIATTDGRTPVLESIDRDPAGWVAEITERVFALGRSRPRLAPLYGRPPYTWVRFPDVAPTGLAADCLEWRGEMSLEEGAFDDARRAFELLSETGGPNATELAARAELGLGEAARRTGAFEEATRRYRAAGELFATLEDPLGIASARKGLGVVAYRRGDLDAAERHGVRALEGVLEHGTPREVADALFNLGNVVADRGDPDGAIAHYDYCAGVYRAIGDEIAVADALCNAGVEDKQRGNLDAAASEYRRALDQYVDAGHEYGEARCLLNLGVVDAQRGRFERSLDRLAIAYRLFDRMDGREQAGAALAKLGETLWLAGRVDAAEYHAREALALAERIGDEEGEASCRVLLAWIAVDRGESSVAIEHAQHAQAIAAVTGHDRIGVDARVVLAAARRIDGAPEESASLLDRALGDAVEAAYLEGECSARIERGRLAWERGDRAGAIDRLERVLFLATWRGALGLVLDAAATLADWLDAVDEPDRADAYRSFANRHGPPADLDPDPLDERPRASSSL